MVPGDIKEKMKKKLWLVSTATNTSSNAVVFHLDNIAKELSKSYDLSLLVPNNGEAEMFRHRDHYPLVRYGSPILLSLPGIKFLYKDLLLFWRILPQPEF